MNKLSLSINDDDNEKESGWVSNFSKYLLPSSFRGKSAPDVDVSSFNPNNSNDIDPIFLEGSTFPQKEEECNVDDDVIDVECFVEEVGSGVVEDGVEVNPEEEVEEEEVAEDAAEPKTNWLKRLRNKFRSEIVVDVPSANDWNATTNDTSWDDNGMPPQEMEPTTADDDTTNSSDDSNNKCKEENATTSKDPRRRRSKPIFHSLETSDIDSATQSKQRKWSRRRKRAAILFGTVKNAALLFLLTFLGGNLMNQFVDLDEDGSFEVRFGKSLSSSSSSANYERSSVDKIERNDSNRKYRPIVRPSRPTTIDRREQPLKLVSQAVQKVGPSVVRVETETDLSDKTATIVADEDRGDIFDGIPEVATEDKSIDFGQGSGIILRIHDEYHILTNSHVVDGASRIHVLLTDGRRLSAELVGSDEIVDVAVLKIVAEENGGDLALDLPVADFGDSDELEVGTFVSF